MESFYELEDQFRASIVEYTAACKERGLDPIEQIKNLVEEELTNN